MSRHSSGGAETALAEGLFALVLLVVAVIIILLVCLVTELYRIFVSYAVHKTKVSKLLWGALAAFLGILLIAGIFITRPETAAIGLITASWGFFAFVVVCELASWSMRRKEVPVVLPKALPDVVSWKKPIEKERSIIS